MNKFKSTKKIVLMLIIGVVICAGRVSVRAQTVWLVCHFDTSSIWKDKDGREKFERRFYVSGLVSMSKADYLRIDSTGERIEGLCGDYLDKTELKPPLRAVKGLIPAAN